MLPRRLTPAATLSFSSKQFSPLCQGVPTATSSLFTATRLQQAFSVQKRQTDASISEGAIALTDSGNKNNRTAQDYGAVPAYKKPPSVPVGVHLDVQHGGGTNSVTDPYVRRQPNQPTRLPESTVFQGATSSVVFTEEERMNPKLLANRRLPVGEWLRKQFADTSNAQTSQTIEAINNTGITNSTSPQQGCPLLWYIQSLALPYKVVGPAEQTIIANFEETIIPEASQERNQEANMERTRWQHTIVRKFTEELFLFNPEKFQEKLESLRKDVLGFFDGNTTGGGADGAYADELEAVFTILVDNAKAIRNYQLKQLTAIVSSTVHEEGGLVWSRFFDVIERNKDRFQLSDENPENLAGKRLAMWIASQEAATPVVSPAMCLLFLAVTSLDTRQAPAKPHALLETLKNSITAKDYIPSSSSTITTKNNNNNNNLWSLVDQILTREELFDFCHRHVDDFLAPMDAHVVRSLRQVSCFSDLASAVENVSSGASTLMETESEKLFRDIFPAFENVTAVHSLVQRVYAMSSSSSSSSNSSCSTSTNVRSFITNLLQRFVDENSSSAEEAANVMSSNTSTTSSSFDLNPYFKALHKHWPGISSQFARDLLANPEVAQQVSHSAKTVNLASGTAKTRSASTDLFEKQHVQDALRGLSNMYFEQKELAEQTQIGIKYQLLSRTENVSTLAQLLISSAEAQRGTEKACELSGEIDGMMKKRVEQRTNEPARPDWFYKAAVDQVAAENPNWLKKEVDVIHPTTDLVVAPDALLAHELLLRIYLRLTYVPHAANAVLKSRHRRRIGRIAKHKSEFNVEAEIGFVESYNTLDYKQWDWQGWYQRMLDVFHRNISIRVRLDDMRRLDNEGKPFIDLQTERRLRILSDDRVGSGMLKLDSDRFEDKSDNLDYGHGKMQQLLSEAKKAQLGQEYWPTVEVKVREPSGQSKMRYSTLDWERMEKTSKEMFEKYRTAKNRSIYVPPTETWLSLGSSAQSTKVSSANVDEEGYTVDSLFDQMKDEKK